MTSIADLDKFVAELLAETPDPATCDKKEPNPSQLWFDPGNCDADPATCDKKEPSAPRPWFDLVVNEVNAELARLRGQPMKSRRRPSNRRQRRAH